LLRTLLGLNAAWKAEPGVELSSRDFEDWNRAGDLGFLRWFGFLAPAD
jgi:hypothetical protein